MNQSKRLPHFRGHLWASDGVEEGQNFFIVIHDSILKDVSDGLTDDPLQLDHDSGLFLDHVQHRFQGI